MSENEVKKAFDAIEPEDGAQERIYANILKKAAAQRAAALEGNVDAVIGGTEDAAPHRVRLGSLLSSKFSLHLITGRPVTLHTEDQQRHIVATSGKRE